MFIRNLLMIILAGTLFTVAAPHAFAGEGEGKEKGEGEGKKGKEKESKKDNPEWMDLQNQINTLESRLQQKRENFIRLIEEKHKAKNDSPEAKAAIDEMISDYKETKTMQEEYNKKIVILKFRFPERGMTGTRKYEKIEIKPLEQMERELSTDGKLNRNMEIIRSQYQSPEEKAEAGKKGAEKSTTPAGPKEKSVDEADTIILKK